MPERGDIMCYGHCHYGSWSFERVGFLFVATRTVTNYDWLFQYQENIIYVLSDGKVKAVFHDGFDWEATVLFGSFDDLSDDEYFFLVGRYASILHAAETHIRKQQENSLAIA